MDSTLLEQIRHLCRDRAAYERLKAILVQQERLHQLSWEERYKNLVPARAPNMGMTVIGDRLREAIDGVEIDNSSPDMATVISGDRPREFEDLPLKTSGDTSEANKLFTHIIAREKSLAQLTDAIQRSPSLDLVLQIAVQVAQKLLEVDRVAIFRRHADGRGEFITDAIAAGMTSLADMPERQLSLARHMTESAEVENTTQTIDNIRSSSLSAHIVTVLEQIGISSYAANKIYLGQELWGTLVAFHGSFYHGWSESDRTSLGLIASQISVAIAIANLRQQSHTLSNDVKSLQLELETLQTTVSEIVEQQRLAKPENEDNDITEAETIGAVLQDEILTEPEEVTGETLAEEDITEAEAITVEVIQTADLAENDLVENITSPFKTAIPVQEQEYFLQQSFQDIPQDVQEYISEWLGSEENKDEVKEAVAAIAEAETEVDFSDDKPTLESFAEDITNAQEIYAPEVNAISDRPEPELSQDSDMNDHNDHISDLLESEIPQVSDLADEIVNADQLLDESNLADQVINENQLLDVLDESNLADEAVNENQLLIAAPAINSVIDTDEADKANAEINNDLPKIIDQNIDKTSLEEIEETNNHDLEDVIIENNVEMIEDIKITFPMSRNGVPPLYLIDHHDQENVGHDVCDEEDTSENIEAISEIAENESEAISEKVTDSPPLELAASTNWTSVNSDDASDDRDPAIEPQFIETILTIAGNGPKANEFLLGVIDDYLEETPRLVQAIDRAIATNEQAKLLQLLNTLRSSSEYIGALSVSYQCRQLESAVRANYVVLIYASLSQVAIESQRAADALRIERSRYSSCSD